MILRLFGRTFFGHNSFIRPVIFVYSADRTTIFVYSAFVFVCFSSVFRLFGWILRLFGYFAYSASSKVHAGLFGHSGKTNVFFHLPVGRGLGRISNEYHFWKTRVSGITFYACINIAYNVAKNAHNDLYACLRYLCMFIF